MASVSTLATLTEKPASGRTRDSSGPSFSAPPELRGHSRWLDQGLGGREGGLQNGRVRGSGCRQCRRGQGLCQGNGEVKSQPLGCAFGRGITSHIGSLSPRVSWSARGLNSPLQG